MQSEWLEPMPVTDLTALEAALRASWGPDTAFDPAAWSPSCPECGQCAVSALVVQDYLGGELLRGTVNGESHYWNRLPSGEEADFTRGQFAEFEPVAVITRPREYVLSFPPARERYRVLAGRAAAALGGGADG